MKEKFRARRDLQIGCEPVIEEQAAAGERPSAARNEVAGNGQTSEVKNDKVGIEDLETGENDRKAEADDAWLA